MNASRVSSAEPALEAFRSAARSVPAYRTILGEAHIDVAAIETADDFTTLPVLDKSNTFQRFGIAELCRGGQLGRLASVLTSSGHSGVFAFGLSDPESVAATATWIDDLLDMLFGVRSKRTLLINCLPMGVKVPSHACTLAETSVRPDMAIGLVKGLGAHFSQIILIGDAAFIKHILESGLRSGVDWTAIRVHIIAGEEPLAENARRYLGDLLGTDGTRPGDGIIASSMGVAELGLNLFSEVPPVAPLILLRRLLHENGRLRQLVFGNRLFVPSLFTYDPRRIFVEFDATGRLIVTTLEPRLRIPLIRYATGDRGGFLDLPDAIRPDIESRGVSWEMLERLPIVAIAGRGEHALAGEMPVYPEAVKEGIYSDSRLAALTTANFRIISGPEAVRVRIQLSPGVLRTEEIEHDFLAAISRYVTAPMTVACEPYETFVGGMAVDFERKFNYLST